MSTASFFYCAPADFKRQQERSKLYQVQCGDRLLKVTRKAVTEALTKCHTVIGYQAGARIVITSFKNN